MHMKLMQMTAAFLLKEAHPPIRWDLVSDMYMAGDMAGDTGEPLLLGAQASSSAQH